MIMSKIKIQDSINIKHHSDSNTSLVNAIWGQAPSARYERIASKFRPIFEKIKLTRYEREKNHQLAFEQIQWLKDSGFTRLRLDKEFNGEAVTLPELFALLIELASADANLPQILRVHFGFVEDLLLNRDQPFHQDWIRRVAQGEIIGSAWSEGGKESIYEFNTRIHLDSQGNWVLNGEKYYTTGSLYADWVDVGVTHLDGQSASVLVSRKANGVEIVDDWNGFGQVLTASGSAKFNQVIIDPDHIFIDSGRFKYSAAFYQLLQLAIITGLTRASSYEVAELVQKRSRNYTHSNANFVRDDPQILQIVGKTRGAAYTAGAIVEKNAQALQRAFEASFQSDEQYEFDQNAIAELEVAQSQTIITQLALDASTSIFDALGASATDKKYDLDRFWRNIRTLASHNPRIYKDRIVGDFAVNGTLPPYQWRIGTVDQNIGLHKKQDEDKTSLA